MPVTNDRRYFRDHAALGQPGRAVKRARPWPWLALAPSVLLAASVLFSAISGNDKAPFVVLAVIVIDAIVLLAFVLVAVVVRPPLPYRWQACALAAAPLAYCVLVFIMARARWVDSLPLLGFR